MTFDEMMAILQNPGDDGVPGTIYDDLSASYSLAVDGGTAKAAEMEATNSGLTSEIDRLKALNFDLLMAAAGSADTETTEPETEKSDDDSIESLFDKAT